MSDDGPLDFGSGYLFESQKSISDRRSARGFPAEHSDAGQGRIDESEGAGGGMGFIGAILTGICILVWNVATFVLPILAMAAWEIVKLVGHVLVAISTNGKRR